VKFLHRTLPSFWECYNRLPEDIRRRADKQYEILIELPGHRSLQLKPVGDLWSARVTDAYRALAIREGLTFVWFWIGSHDEYERLLKE
jgi:D-hexose-6-phosphate mutarotase